MNAGKTIADEHIVTQPLVSIITVVYNGVKTLADTLRSVQQQTYPNIEHIVIDGGSTDGTLEVLRSYGGHLSYWVSEPDAGIYDAMNKGIAQARGDYVGMLNADDYFAHTEVISTIVSRLMETGVDAVFSSLDIVDQHDENHILRKCRIANYSRFMLRIGLMPPHPTFYCKRSCYGLAGPYRTEFRIGGDYEMLLRLLLKHRISWCFIDETTVKMRAGGVSTRGLKSLWRLNREIVQAANENGLYTNMWLLTLKIPVRLLERIS